MLFTQNRNRLRLFFCEAWERYRDNLPLQPLEQQIADVISMHPEYHELLEDRKAALGMEPDPKAGEGNPFLHLALHISIREQIENDQPSGIGKIYRRLLARAGDEHQVEHRMMECLATALWESQVEGSAMDGEAYMRRLKAL